MTEVTNRMTARDWIAIAINAALLAGGLTLFNWRVGVIEVRLDRFEMTFVRKETLEAQQALLALRILRLEEQVKNDTKPTTRVR